MTNQKKYKRLPSSLRCSSDMPKESVSKTLLEDFPHSLENLIKSFNHTTSGLMRPNERVSGCRDFLSFKLTLVLECPDVLLNTLRALEDSLRDGRIKQTQAKIAWDRQRIELCYEV